MSMEASIGDLWCIGSAIEDRSSAKWSILTVEDVERAVMKHLSPKNMIQSFEGNVVLNYAKLNLADNICALQLPI